jgi:hypothetical protein
MYDCVIAKTKRQKDGKSVEMHSIIKKTAHQEGEQSTTLIFTNNLKFYI